jgi:hypothetical protein
VQIAPATIRHDLDSKLHRVWNQGHIRVGDLWDYYTKYPYLPRLRDKTVLMRAIEDVVMDIAWAQTGFALADDFDSASGDFKGLTVPLEDDPSVVTDDTYLVAPHVASAQRAREQAAVRPSEPAVGTRTSDPVPTDLSSTSVTTRQSPVTVSSSVVERARYEGRYEVDASEPEAIAGMLRSVIEEVIRHVVSAPGAENVSIVLEVSAENSEGFSESVARTVRENSKVLGFDKSDFEDVEW